MAIAHVLSVTGVHVDTAIQTSLSTGTFTSAAGQFVVVTGLFYSAGGITWGATPIADSFGNTWTQVGSDSQSTGLGHQWLRHWWAVLTAGGAGHTITMTTSANTEMALVADVFSGVGTTVDTFSVIEYNSSNVTTAFVATSLVTAHANDLILGWCSTDNSKGLTPTYTLGSSVQGGFWYGAGHQWTVVSATGTYTPSWTLSGADSGFVGAVAYQDTVTIRTYTGSGGLAFAGAATRLHSRSRVGSGGLTFAGTATTQQTGFAYHPTGGLALAGVAPHSFVATGPSFQEPAPPASVEIHVNPPLRTILAPTFAAYQAALVAAKFGDEIVLTPGVEYVGAVALGMPSGTIGSLSGTGAGLLLPPTLTFVGASPLAATLSVAATVSVATNAPSVNQNYVTIRTSGVLPPAGMRVAPVDTAQMPTLRAPDANAYCVGMAVPGIHHYRFVGLRFTTTPGSSAGGIFVMAPDQSMDRTVQATYPHHISVESCYFAADEDYGVNKTIALQGPHMQVKDTYVTNAYQLGNGDANCVWIDLSPGPYLIDNCLLEGMGENLLAGAESNSGIPIIPGFQYAVCSDITIRKSHFRRRYSWKSDDPSYRAPCDLVGTGTFTSQGATVKFSIDQTANALPGHSLKRLATNEVRRIVAGTGTTYTLASAFTTDVATGEAWRWNSVDLSCKNNFEVKGANRMLVEDCLFEKGWGGQGVSFTFTPRRNADISDFHMRYCKWKDTLGMAWSNGDWEQGLDLNASFRSTQRFRMEHVLWENTCGPRSLPGANKAIFWNVAGIEWGRFFNFPGATCRASATTGTGIACISNTAIFAPEYVGLQLRFGAGRGTVTTVSVDGMQVLVTITTPFPDTLVHPLYPGWRIGPAAFLDSTPYLIPDSCAFEHCTFAGVDTGYDYVAYLASNGPVNNPGVDLQPPVATNLVWRNNVQHAGVTPGNGNGFVGEANLIGTAGANVYADAVSRDFRKNVLFGPALLTSFNFGAAYTGDLEGGAGAAHLWGLHDPDYNGANGGGPVGFVDYLNGDYRLAPTSPYRNWGTDGTDPGCDLVTLAARLVGVASPEFTSPATTKVYQPLGGLHLSGTAPSSAVGTLTATFFVATNGSDSFNGRAATFQGGTVGPWRTIGAAALRTGAGQTTMIRNGTYVEPQINLNGSGTVSAPITFLAESKWGAILSTTSVNLAISINGSYITIDGLRIKVDPSIQGNWQPQDGQSGAIHAWQQQPCNINGPTDNGIFGITLRNLKIDAASPVRSLGIKLNSDDSLIEYCTVSTAIEALNIRNSTYRYNYIDGTDGWGTMMVIKGGSRNFQCYGNEFHVPPYTAQQGNVAVCMGGQTGLFVGWLWDVNNPYECFNSFCHDNIVFNETGVAGYDLLIGEQGGYHNTFTNNTIHGGNGQFYAIGTGNGVGTVGSTYVNNHWVP